jgi:hypothetical protein
MAHHFKPTPDKTYATYENAIKAVERIYGPSVEGFADTDLRYIIMQDESGRYFPMFIGMASVQHQVFRHFCCMA